MIDDYKGEKLCFKLFGDILTELESAKNQIYEMSNGSVTLDFSEKNLDIKAVLNIENSSDVNVIDKVCKSFINTFSSFIYANQDVSLQENAVNLLKISNRTLSTAESFTGGSMAKAIVEIPGASEIFYEGFVCYNTKSKEEILGVSHNTVITKTVVSREVAFEMVKGLLERGKCDVALCSTGYASPTGDPNKPCGLCFLSAGCEKRVEVVRYNFFGSRTEIMEKGKNAGLFLLNKILKGGIALDT